MTASQTLPAQQRVVGSYSTYPQAQRAVDFLSGNHFPVQRTAIIGSDLRSVETVLGRLTRGRAALGGAGSGAWFGLLVGVLLTVFPAGHFSALVLLATATGLGALFGAAFAFAAQSAGGGRRAFVSRREMVAARYDVVADLPVADDAVNLLIKFGWREDR